MKPNRSPGAIRLSVLVLVWLVLPKLSFASGEWPPAQLPGWREYWASRKIVTIAAYRTGREKLDSTAVLDDRGDPSRADSVRQVIERRLKRRPGDPIEYVQVPLDSSALRYPSRQEVPDFVARRFASGHFHDWIAALSPRVPQRGLRAFIAIAKDSLWSPLERNVLGGTLTEGKGKAGVLAMSPDSEFVLDPFAEMEIGPAGDAEFDVDDGYAVYEAKSGDMVGWDVGTDRAFHLGTWLDADRFLLVGSIRMDSPVFIQGTYLYALAPVICVGDMRRHILVSYVGPPIDGKTETKFLRVQKAAYPKVRW